MTRRTALVLVGLLPSLLAACGKEAPPQVDKLAAARRSLDEGLPRRALADIGEPTAGPDLPLLIVRLQALIAISEWGQVERLMRAVPAGAEKVALECMFAAERRGVEAERICRAIDASKLDPTLGDAVRRGYGRALETEQRGEESELTLRQLATEHPTNANRKAVVGLLERQGFVREAVTFLESWLAASPGDKSLEMKLVQTLERKLRGDLLEKRAVEAEAAARRILALDPSRAQMRYFLADALEMKGDKTAAEAERATAKAAGATPPVPVDSFPGMDPEHDHPPGKGHDHP